MARIRYSPTAWAALVSVSLAAHAAAQVVTTSYIGPNNGSWDTAANWSGGAVPNNGAPAGVFYEVRVLNGTTVVIPVSVGRAIHDLQIGLGNRVTVSNNSALTFNDPAGSTLDVAGDLKIDATSSNSDLVFNTASNLIGGGTITLSGANSRVYGNNRLTVTNGSIVGRGSVGLNLMTFTNAGLFDANISGAVMLIDPANASDAFVNNGTMRASGGGFLQLTGNGFGTFNNSAGVIEALASSTVQLITGVGVTGGTYRTPDPTGLIEVPVSNSAGASDFSNTGRFAVQNNASLSISGNITNSGTLSINATSSNADLSLASATTFNGTGSIVMAGANSRVLGSGRLTNGIAHRIEGRGSLGTNAIAITNNGLVTANISGATLWVDPANTADAFVNTGTLRAENGGILNLTGNGFGAFTNTGALIEATGASSVVQLLTGVNITGGTIRGVSGGIVQVPVSDSAAVNGATFAGSARVLNNATLAVAGTMTNTGTLTLEAGSSVSDLSVNFVGTATTLNGGGTLRLASTTSGSNARVLGSGELINTSHTIEGEGNLGANTISITNNSLVHANVNGRPLVLDPRNIGGTNLSFINNGTLRASNGATLILTGNGFGAFGNALGTIEALAGSTVRLTAGVAVSEGTLRTPDASGTVSLPVSDSATLVGVTNLGRIVTENNSTLGLVGTITNSGTITANATSSFTDISVADGTSFLGTGKVILGGTSSNGRIVGSGVLTIGVGQTVEGKGNVGTNVLSIQNNGLIHANVNGASLVVDPRNIGGTNLSFVNDGTLRASNGASLVLTGSGLGAFDNAGNTIEALTDSTVVLTAGVGITGGTLATPNATGSINLGVSDTAGLSAVTIAGRLATANNSTLFLAGTTTVNGSITVIAGASLTDISVADGTSFVGTGKTILTGSGNARVVGGGVLTIGSSHTVEGTGNLGTNVLSVVNNGLVHANVAGASLAIDPRNIGGPNLSFDNNGTLRASNGATLILTGSGLGAFDNSGSTIEALAGSTVRLTAGVGIVAGTLSTPAGTGSFSLPISDSAALVGVTLNGRLQTENNSTLFLSGVFTNTGTLTVNAGSSTADISIADGTTLTGSGRTILSGSSSNARLVGGGTLTIAAGHTVEGKGNVGTNVLSVINDGTINASIASTVLTIDPRNIGGANLSFVNNGTLRASNGGTLSLTGSGLGAFAGTGVIEAQAGSTIQAAGGANLNFTTNVTGAGTFNADTSSDVTVTAYRVGALTATNSSTARIRAGGGNAGTSKVTSVSASTSGRVDVTDHGLIVDYTGASPAAAIRALLTSGRQTGAWQGPGIGSSLASAANGFGVGYAEASDLGLVSFLGLPVDASSVLIRFTLVGDVNLSGGVDFSDLLSLAQNYSDTGTGRVWSQGDFTYNGLTNFDDLLGLAQNYGTTLLSDGSTSSDPDLAGSLTHHWAVARSLVPEPTSLGLVVLGALCFTRRR
jgi:hypothetical protein